MVRARDTRLAPANWRTTVNVNMTSAGKEFPHNTDNTADTSSSDRRTSVDHSHDRHRDHQSSQEMPDEVNSKYGIGRSRPDVSDEESAADNSSDFDVPVYFGQHQQSSQHDLTAGANTERQVPRKKVRNMGGPNNSSDFAVPRRSRQKLFLCNECGKTFSQKHVLAKHQLIHAGETPFPCTFCKRRFRTKFNLERHEGTHTGKKPHICSECGIAFGQKGQLDSHRFIHTGKKPHECDECGRSFSKKNTLDRHKLTHSGEKLHPCSECGKSFTRKYRLSQHKQTHVQRTEVPEAQNATEN